jgi:hypothetical protein
MVTTNDAVFSILFSCKDTLDSSRLIYYIYLLKLSKLNFNFKFKLNASGLVCRGLDEFIGDLINQDKIKFVDDSKIELTDLGYLYYDNTVLTLDDWDLLNHIKSLLDTFTEDELFFICVTDMIVYDILGKYGGEGLLKQKDNIIASISSLSNDYTDENFDAALKIIRQIRGGFDNE